MDVYVDSAQELRQILHRPPILPQAIMRASYSLQQFDFNTEIQKYLLAEGFIAHPVPLEELHNYVAKQAQLPLHQGRSTISALLDKMQPGMIELYEQFIKYVARNVLGFDVVFERVPVVRFHFPVASSDRYRGPDGRLVAYHTDTLLGDYLDQINCWLPLSRCYGSNALQQACFEPSLNILDRFCRGFDYEPTIYFDSRELFYKRLCDEDDYREFVISSCRPVQMEVGELLLFDSRVVHGTAENKESHTRVSIDFRLVSVGAYEMIMQRLRDRNIQPTEYNGYINIKGSCYHEKTAFEL